MITAVLISCIGLFGLSVFMARKRTKEIGIRKVLGASVLQISSLLCREYLFLVLIAILIASPVAGYLAHKWLQNYAYRMEINGWAFVMAGIAALMISLVTVIFQSVKAGLTNPVSTLRNE